MNVRALVVEDEPLARRTLVELLREVSWLECVGTAADGAEAIERIDALRPDLVFLDVRLPEATGLEVLERARHRPMVIFTTAYDRYAVAAFELEAVDYLLKPFGRKRLLASLDRVRRRFEAAAGAAAAPPAREGLFERPLRRLFARKGSRLLPVDLARVAHVRASGDYAELLAGGETFLVHVSLSDLEARLDPARFRRVHRCHIVNLDRVVALEPYDDRRLVVVLEGGRRVVASRAGSRALRELAH